MEGSKRTATCIRQLSSTTKNKQKTDHLMTKVCHPTLHQIALS